MNKNPEREIFKKGSTTFFMSSLFFPRNVRKDVFDLYSFVRVADNYVDQVPGDRVGFLRLRRLWEESSIDPNFNADYQTDDSIDLRVVKNMLRVSRKHNFEPAWTTAFLDSMESDLTAKHYKTLDDMLWYIYGSAEVIGLMMANIMGLKPEAAEAAQLQGRAMQVINFIRDIKEDIDLGRRYFPEEDLKRFSLPDLTEQSATQNPDAFNKFIQFQLNRYDSWQKQAYTGYSYVPKRLRIPLQTATDMYNWTAEGIRKNPLIVFETQLKPKKSKVVKQIAKNLL
jgi:15-cis-phytoene synthase